MIPVKRLALDARRRCPADVPRTGTTGDGARAAFDTISDFPSMEPSSLDSVGCNGGSFVRDARRVGAVPPELLGGRDAAAAVVVSRGSGPRRRMAVTKSIRVSVGVVRTGVNVAGGTRGKCDGKLLAAVEVDDDDADDNTDGDDGRELEEVSGGETAAPQLARRVAQAKRPVSMFGPCGCVDG